MFIVRGVADPSLSGWGYPPLLKLLSYYILYYYVMILQNSEQEMNRKRGHN